MKMKWMNENVPNCQDANQVYVAKDWFPINSICQEYLLFLYQYSQQKWR